MLVQGVMVPLGRRDEAVVGLYVDMHYGSFEYLNLHGSCMWHLHCAF